MCYCFQMIDHILITCLNKMMIRRQVIIKYIPISNKYENG